MTISLSSLKQAFQNINPRKPTAEAIRQIGKSVSDNEWGTFTAYLNHKLEDMYKQLIKVDKFLSAVRFVYAAINTKNEGMRIALA